VKSKDNNTTFEDLKEAVRKFVRDREWEKYHTPRNLAESISIESCELLELFQWSLSEDESSVDSMRLSQLEDELADILVYCISLANVTKIDVTTAILNKMKKNEQRYPAQKYKGTYSKPEKE
jgi:NTP pyrophosphatase (non-canonical NTP hydrolase)